MTTSVHLFTERHVFRHSQNDQMLTFAREKTIMRPSLIEGSWDRITQAVPTRSRKPEHGFELEVRRWKFWLRKHPIESLELRRAEQYAVHYEPPQIQRQRDRWWTVSWSLVSPTLGVTSASRMFRSARLPGRSLRQWLSRIQNVAHAETVTHPDQAITLPAAVWLAAIPDPISLMTQRSWSGGRWSQGPFSKMNLDRSHDEGDDAQIIESRISDTWRLTPACHAQATSLRALAFAAELNAFLLDDGSNQYRLWTPDRPFYKLIDQARFDNKFHQVDTPDGTWIIPDMVLPC